ncbi:MAG: polysaccharide biosynthesis protein [Flavobacteriales bacterium]|nr:polysaccharide biosynthesis protein [Flavobacteriales bacterium]
MPKLIQEILIRALLAIGCCLYFLDLLTFQDFIIWIIGIYATALALLIVYVKKLGHLFLRPDLSIFRSEMSKEMTFFSLYTILGSGSGIIVSKIDTIMLGSMSGLDAAGIYGVAFYLGAIIQMPRRTLSEISSPIIAKAFKENNLSKIEEIYQKTSLNLLLVGAFLFTGIWVNIDSVLLLIPNSAQFLIGKYVVFYIGLVKLIDMAFGLNTEVITNSKYYRWNIFFLPFLALITIVSNLLLIPKFGIVGAAIASFISISLINVLRFLFVWYRLKIHPFTINTPKALLICGTAYFLGNILPIIENTYLDILQRGTVVTVAYLVLLLLIKPSEDVDNLIRGFWKKITSNNAP